METSQLALGFMSFRLLSRLVTPEKLGQKGKKYQNGEDGPGDQKHARVHGGRMSDSCEKSIVHIASY